MLTIISTCRHIGRAHTAESEMGSKKIEALQRIRIIRLAWREMKEGSDAEALLPMIDIMLCVDEEEAEDFVVNKKYKITIEGVE